MADLIVKSSGRKFFKVNGELAALLTEMFPGEIEKIKQEQRAFNLGQGNTLPVTQRKPQWSVGTQKRNGWAVLKLVIPTGEEYEYQFKPEQAQATFTRMGWPVPQQYLDAYAAAFSHQPETVLRDPTPEDNLMGEHYRRDRLNATPTPERYPIL